MQALHSLTVTFKPGEVHAVVGENGAGKSTLMNILGGFLEPTSGQVVWGDTRFPVGSAKSCRRLGIEMVHQHFMLVPEFTVDENLSLSLLGLGESVSLDELKKKADEFEWDFSWEAKVKELPVGVQQRIEILKTMSGNPKVVIFDEPTAVLSEAEAASLLDFLRTLANQGKIVILIAHKIEEVLSVADQITVLRKGKHIVTKPKSEVSKEQLVHWMVGETVPESDSRTGHEGEVRLKARDLLVEGDRKEVSVSNVSFDVSAGTILGIGGVDGNGQLELSEALAGVRNITSGFCDAGTTRVGFVPQDRRADGLALEMSVSENMLVSALPKMGKVLVSRKINAWAESLIEQYQIKVQSPRESVSQLSGGNQQKVILARVLDQEPELLIVVNPTRGLDVKAAAFVHTQLRKAASRGAAVVLFSADRDELLSVSDAQLWMSRGKLFSSETEAYT